VLGTIGLTVRYGSKPIEFEKRKMAIVVLSKEQLPATIDTAIAAVRGEMDELLAQQDKVRDVPKSKRVA
jgi:hypothetical protein